MFIMPQENELRKPFVKVPDIVWFTVLSFL